MYVHVYNIRLIIDDIPAERDQPYESLQPPQRHCLPHILCGETRAMAGHETHGRR